MQLWNMKLCSKNVTLKFMLKKFEKYCLINLNPIKDIIYEMIDLSRWLKREKALHKQDKEPKYAIIVLQKLIFHVPVHQLLQPAQYAIE
jgi:hypothetical protein